MGCSQTNILDKKPQNNPKSSEEEIKDKKLDEHKKKDAEAPNERNKNNIEDYKNSSEPLNVNNESKKIKEVNAISKNEPKQLIKQEKNHLEENKMDDKNDFKVPATNQEENKKDDEKKKKESEKVNKAYIEEDKKGNGNIYKVPKENKKEEIEKSNENKKNIEVNKTNLDSKNENDKEKKNRRK